MMVLRRCGTWPLTLRVPGTMALGLLLAGLGSLGCGGSSEPGDRVDVDVTLELMGEPPQDPLGPPNLAAISIRGPGMGVLVRTFAVTPAGTLSFLFGGVHVGEERTVTAELRNEGGALLYRGVAKADFARGELGRVTVVVQAQLKTISILNDVLSEGKVGDVYADTLIAIGNEARAAENWAIVANFLPPGLELDPTTGAISGTPDRAGEFSFEVRVEAGEANATRYVEIIILPTEVDRPLLRLQPSILPIAQVSRIYRVRFSASGGEPPFRFKTDPDEERDPANGTGLPEGMFLQIDGRIRGTARAVPFDQRIGTTHFTVLAEDSSIPRKLGRKTYALTVISHDFFDDPRFRDQREPPITIR